MNRPPELTCHILDTGHCLAHEHVLIQGGGRKPVACHSLAALLGHPEHGWLLWDAGYAPRMWEATAHFPYSLYRLATPLRLRPELAVAAHLPRLGLTPADVRTVLISHFHADHLCGLHDLPYSRFVASQEAYMPIANKRGLAAMRRAFIPSLLPADFTSRLTLLGAQLGAQASPPAFARQRGQAGTPALQTIALPPGPELPNLRRTLDFYGDGSLLLVRLPGHARGQLGMLANTDRGRIFFVADSCWLARSVTENRTVGPLGSLITDSPRQLAATIAQLHAFAQSNPDVMIVPSHCPETLAELLSSTP